MTKKLKIIRTFEEHAPANLIALCYVLVQSNKFTLKTWAWKFRNIFWLLTKLYGYTLKAFPPQEFFTISLKIQCKAVHTFTKNFRCKVGKIKNFSLIYLSFVHIVRLKVAVWCLSLMCFLWLNWMWSYAPFKYFNIINIIKVVQLLKLFKSRGLILCVCKHTHCAYNVDNMYR